MIAAAAGRDCHVTLDSDVSLQPECSTLVQNRRSIIGINRLIYHIFKLITIMSNNACYSENHMMTEFSLK